MVHCANTKVLIALVLAYEVVVMCQKRVTNRFQATSCPFTSPLRIQLLLWDFLSERSCLPSTPEPWHRDYTWEEKQVIKQVVASQFLKELTPFAIEHAEVQVLGHSQEQWRLW